VEGFRVQRWGEDPVWDEIPEKPPGRGEVAIEVEACGVGRTVLNCINGDLSDGRAALPRVPGHELVGRVTELGPRSDPDLVGRRVAAYFYLFCGECKPCVRGQEPWCERLEGWVGVHRDGGYAPRVTLPARNAILLSDGLDPVAATVIPDALATPVHVANRAEIGDEDRVVVVGAGGGVGIHMIQVALARSAAVVGLDVGVEKLAEIDRLGATAVDSSDFEDVPAVRLFSGGLPTVIVDLIGTTESTAWSLDALGMGGRLVVLTTFPDRPQPFEARRLVFCEAAILGSRYATRSEVAKAAQMVASGDIAPIVGRVAGAGEVLDLHRALESGALTGRGALNWSQRTGREPGR
jgi:D-arabinose 1-dehydrogenase-like Zn-dependent alcohol dehydrogenase